MKMSKSFCCDKCLDMLAKESTAVQVLWHNLCEMQIKMDMQSKPLFGFGFMNANFPALKSLETKGFVVTHETDEFTWVKVKGKIEDGETIYFCGGCCGD